MKANELRVNNWVYCIEDHVNIEILPSDVQLAGQFKPILLTEEWLLKFGFEEVELSIPRKWNNKKFRIRENHPNRYFVSYKYGHVELIHVHQLQNLYFALTGEELTIKEQ